MELMRRLSNISISGKSVAAMLALALLFFSCRKNDGPSRTANLESFLAKQEAGLFGYGGFLFKYTPEDCQISINVKRNMIRLQNDSQTNWMHVHLANYPSYKGETIELELRYMAGGDEIVSLTAMEVAKAENDRFWLWDAENNMGIILPHCW